MTRIRTGNEVAVSPDMVPRGLKCETLLAEDIISGNWCVSLFTPFQDHNDCSRCLHFVVCFIYFFYNSLFSMTLCWVLMLTSFFTRVEIVEFCCFLTTNCASKLLNCNRLRLISPLLGRIRTSLTCRLPQNLTFR